MKKTGELLRKAREEKGLSINEIGLSLKISNRILSAIEDGDLSRLPAKTFLRGFVQSYANYLKINSDEVLEVFREEMGSTQPQPVIDPAVQNANATPSEKETAIHTTEKSPIESASPALPTSGPSFKGLLISVVCILLVVCIYGVKRVIERYQRESVTEAVEVASPLPEPTAEALSSTDEEVKPDQSLPALAVVPPTPPMSSEPEKTEAKETPAAAKPAPAAAPATAVVEKPTPAPAPTPAPPAKPEPVVAATPAAAAEQKPQGRPLELVIEALDTVEVEYSNAAGEVVERLKLSADQVHTIRGRQGLKLKVSNGGAVNVILNGKDMGVAGDLGKPATLTY